MKNRMCCFLLLWLSIAMNAYAGQLPTSVATGLIQNPEGRNTTSLDGQWSYIIDQYETGYYNHRYEVSKSGWFKNRKMVNSWDLIEYDFSTADKIDVPGDWNSQKEHMMFYEGTVWYHKDFSVNKKVDKRYVVNFGAVNYQAIVYVNGEKVGSHQGGFTGFQFDITEKLKDGSNFIVVKVDNRRERNQVPTVNTDWWNYGGITRSVSLLELPGSYLADYKIQLSKKDQSVITGSFKISGKPKTGEKITLRIPELDVYKQIEVGRSGTASFNLEKQAELWSPEIPKLYQVELEYNGETIQDHIGFRTIEVDGSEIKLNGQSLYLRGISIHEESPLTNGRAWSEEDARLLLGWAKELGCNFVRLAHYPHNEFMVKVADELGLMVWSEIPVYWTVVFENEEVYVNAEQQLTEMISRDKNRASVIMWSVANETPNHEQRLNFLTDLVEKARGLDDTRLITAALDTQTSSKNGKLIDDPLANVVDVIGINAYCGWYGKKPEECSSLSWESKYLKPVIMSEFGGGALQGLHGKSNERWTEEYQAAVYEHNLQMIENFSLLRGVTPWILKDFRSPKRPLANIQDYWNRKGLLSETGEKKQAWYVLRDFYLQKQQEQARQ